METTSARLLGERGVEETLDAVEVLWLEALEGNCEIFLLAAHYADLCSGDGLAGAGSGRVLPGTERAVRLGGAGTPRVAEFAAAAFGARMRMGAVGGRAMVADALDARHRLPAMYARVVAREARVPWVRYVARKTRELSVEAARRVDAELAGSVDGSVPWSRFCARLEGVIVAADPEAAARREQQARREVFAKATHGSVEGMKGFFVRGPAALVIRFDATVAFLAEALKALGDTDDEDERRVKACLVMANPMQAVELLAAFAAHRSRTGAGAGTGTGDEGDVPLLDEDDDADEDEPLPEDAQDAQDADEAQDAPAPEADDEDDRSGESGDDGRDPANGPGPVGSLVPFRPGDLPAWLARATDPASSVVLDWPKLLPRVTLHLHLAQETLDAARDGTPTGVVRWEGEGPITLQYVREQLAPFHAFTITPVIDLAGQEPVDSFEIPQRHRRAVRLRTPADCFPFAANLDPVDLDHTQAFEHATGAGQVPEPGQSRMGNYGPLGRFHHRVKTHGDWQVRQPFDGIYVWRDPHGHYYLVDHTGTRKITPPTHRPAKPARPEDGRRPAMVVELYRSGVVIDLDGFDLHAA